MGTNTGISINLGPKGEMEESPRKTEKLHRAGEMHGFENQKVGFKY